MARDQRDARKEKKKDEEESTVEEQSLQSLYEKLDSSAEGLSSAEAKTRLERYGPNAIEDKERSAILKFLSYFWGPIPWMIEVAAVLSAVVHHMLDLFVILALLIFNAIVGFWQERKASNAVDELKKQLAVNARAKRDGKWSQVEATTLVPGDVIRLRLGDIIPADAKLAEGDYLSVDQSALTGESLPVEKHDEDVVYSGSAVKQGEMTALVTATGNNTYFGKTAGLVSKAKSVSHFQKAVLSIGDYLIFLSIGLAVLLILTMLFQGAAVITLFQFALILVVSAIPVAMPAVLSVTMAAGSVALSKMKAIVTHLESIEEMAGADILCSDKTGTLTQNKLTLGDPVVVNAKDAAEVILAAALASKEENSDAIDTAVLQGLEDQSALEGYAQDDFVPFDPVNKRTEATGTDPDGNAYKVTKGAPQVVLEMCRPSDDLTKQVTDKVDAFAAKGYRTLGVAKGSSDDDLQFLGILPLYDPPREDSAETISRAEDYGVSVKMVTGDNVAIAKQISSQLHLGTHIRAAKEFFSESSEGSDSLSPSVAKKVEAADGFAEVFPEHKFEIVQGLQQRGHIVGMTGDGVNDAPALKQANIGIAVSGATDAARAAAALVLTAPGLSVITRAIEEARRIFERMNSYAIYRITETIRIMFFVVFAMIVFHFYPITAIMIILLAFFNDLPIMTIAYDNTWLDPKPVRWDMYRVLTVSTVLGLLGVVETFGMLLIGKLGLHLSVGEIQSLIFLKLAVAGHLTLFVARTKRPFFTKPYPAPILLWSAIGTKVLATLLVVFGLGLVTPIPWSVTGIVWGYCLVWIFIEDWAKLMVYHHLGGFTARHHVSVMRHLKKTLQHYSMTPHGRHG